MYALHILNTQRLGEVLIILKRTKEKLGKTGRRKGRVRGVGNGSHGLNLGNRTTIKKGDERDFSKRGGKIGAQPYQEPA